MPKTLLASWWRFIPIVLTVLGADLAVAILLKFLPDVPSPIAVVAAAVLVATLAAPLLWYLVGNQITRSSEQQRLRADSNMANVLAASIDGIITTDERGIIERFNAGAEKIFGLASSEAIGQPISVLIPEDIRDAHGELLGRFAAGVDASRTMGAVRSIEGRRKDGERFPADVSISRLDIGGSVTLMAVVRDVTERHLAATALREAELRLRMVVNSAPITIWATDADGVITMADGSALAQVGLKSGENVGVSAIALFGTLPFVEHSGLVSSGQEALRRALAGETIVASTELRGTTFESHIGPQRDEAGTIVGVVGVAADITERTEARAAERSSEKRFRAIFDGAPLGIALMDSHTGRFLAVNPLFAGIVGRTVDELARLDWMGITHADDVRQDLDNMALLNAGTISSFQMEKRYLRPDGTSIWVKLTVAPMPFADDAPRHYLAMVEDFTELRRTRTELEQTAARMRGLSHRLLMVQEAERRSLARELHDEIGQTLSATKINLQSLQRFPDPDAAARRIGESVDIVDRALAQVRSLSLSLRPALLDDLGLVPAVQGLADETAHRTGISVDFRVFALDSRFDPATEIACFRIVQGALNNVEKHAGARSAAVELQVRGDGLHALVSDDGMGFDVGNAYRCATAGASLGLIGMEERAMLVGGEVEWHSTPGRGTEVRAWFPLPRLTDGDHAGTTTA